MQDLKELIKKYVNEENKLTYAKAFVVAKKSKNLELIKKVQFQK